MGLYFERAIFLHATTQKTVSIPLSGCKSSNRSSSQLFANKYPNLLHLLFLDAKAASYKGKFRVHITFLKIGALPTRNHLIRCTRHTCNRRSHSLAD
jgi:hypothetical protein